MMLKQTIVQEKLSDLTAKEASIKDNETSKDAIVVSAHITHQLKSRHDGSNSVFSAKSLNRASGSAASNTTTSVNVAYASTSSSKRNGHIFKNTLSLVNGKGLLEYDNNGYEGDNNESNETSNNRNADLDFDGAETLGSYNSMVYASNHESDNARQQHANKQSGGANDSSHFVSGSSSQLRTSKSSEADSIQQQQRNNAASAASMNLNFKLKYLEKSIKFLQQQHQETLQSLHQEIENLKAENRDLNFRMTTTTSMNNANNSTSSSSQSATISHTLNGTGSLLNTHSQQLDHEKKGAGRAGNDNSLSSSSSSQLPKIERADIAPTKTNDKTSKVLSEKEQNERYNSLLARIEEVESKNAYLTNLLAQVQTRQIANGDALETSSRVNPISKVGTIEANLSNRSTSGQASRKPYSLHASTISTKNIVSFEPLLIRLNENEEPRQPNASESHTLIKNLFESHKQQKQQITNMKMVLRDMVQTENLSNHGLIASKEVLDNSNRFTEYFMENENTHRNFNHHSKPLDKLSLANNRGQNFIHQQQLLALNKARQQTQSIYNNPLALNINGMTLANSSSGGGAGLHSSAQASNNTPNNELMHTSLQQYQIQQQQLHDEQMKSSSAVHLPPLQLKGGPTKYSERQRRTNLLQKQRLRKEYFH